MKVRDILVQQGMARSNGEATRLMTQGSVRILKDGCQGGYPIDPTQWDKVMDPRAEIASGIPVIVGNGLWRCVTRTDGRQGFDQLNGVGRS